MEGKLLCLPGELPTLKDRKNLLTTIISEVCGHCQFAEKSCFLAQFSDFGNVIIYCLGHTEEVLGDEGC